MRSIRPGPEAPAADRYHFSALAQEAALRLRDIGLATQIQVIRLADGAILYDLAAGVHRPLAEW
ncbi:hypothetical protein [Thermobispora bispora]|uniref:hypothetical protein n=1 Tax=Thermobispora bispora TaxID=2006 RepID=UPI00030348E7|nr:hypothetical protein [Thermobispora bispora]MBO2475806.1 hypothetical protein [Actinomycetales bacterium]MBX6168058.1 hypothetical protein [Thermobispora bispora]MDI9580790.1 hypothetical protein [Thermobispora sp.]